MERILKAALPGLGQVFQLDQRGARARGNAAASNTFSIGTVRQLDRRLRRDFNPSSKRGDVAPRAGFSMNDSAAYGRTTTALFSQFSASFSAFRDEAIQPFWSSGLQSAPVEPDKLAAARVLFLRDHRVASAIRHAHVIDPRGGGLLLEKLEAALSRAPLARASLPPGASNLEEILSLAGAEPFFEIFESGDRPASWWI